jgi:hypothetical protein
MRKRFFALDVVCPICAARPNEKCTLLSGAPRYESHVERKWIAKDHNPRRSPAELPANDAAPKVQPADPRR